VGDSSSAAAGPRCVVQTAAAVAAEHDIYSLAWAQFNAYALGVQVLRPLLCVYGVRCILDSLCGGTLAWRVKHVGQSSLLLSGCWLIVVLITTVQALVLHETGIF
jgi:hypothetical protein